MAKNDNVFLVGPMGVGKTTIGKKLARRLKKKFFDSDKEIEKRTGATINLIFDVEGEVGFRERESKVIDDLTMGNGIVMATGGGAVLYEANRQVLQERGVVIYLAASAELLRSRTAYDQNRPLLNTGDRLKKINILLKERGHFYSEVADKCLDVDDMTTKDIINEIVKYLDERCEK
jgi:shikimate kinase